MNTTDKETLVQAQLPSSRIKAMCFGKPTEWQGDHMDTEVQNVLNKHSMRNAIKMRPTHGYNYGDTNTTDAEFRGDVCILNWRPVFLKTAGCPIICAYGDVTERVVVAHASRFNLLQDLKYTIVDAVLQHIMSYVTEKLHVNILFGAKPSDMCFSQRDPRYGKKNTTTWQTLNALWDIPTHESGHLDLSLLIQRQFERCLESYPHISPHFHTSHFNPEGDFWVASRDGKKRNLVALKLMV